MPEDVILPIILKLPLEYIDPVNISVSAFAESKVIPVPPTRVVEPLTTKELEITVDPVILKELLPVL